MIWLKLGRMAGSSTQHDCTMNTSSWGVSSGRAGRFCCWYKQEKNIIDISRLQSRTTWWCYDTCSHGNYYQDMLMSSLVLQFQTMYVKQNQQTSHHHDT
jgi:hypothetical protein